PGTGKSHLATALASEACARGYKVRFYRATELVTTLIEARDERSFLRLKTQLAKLDLLVLDLCRYRDYAEMIAAAGLSALCLLGLSAFRPAGLSA
ncbi:MAG TPA: ATP-binding protein, partial [Solirubrobacteraceae bacterium]|nr:ATP-binding protein [Solirubrobacteraceae bacterium]